MIAFGPDTDVPATPVQRVARRALLAACSVLGLGVISSAARLAASPTTDVASTVVTRPQFAAVQPPILAAGNVPPPSVGLVAFDLVSGLSRPPMRVGLVSDHPPATTGRARVRWMLVTAYCGCPKCCGSHAAGITASGRPTSENYGHFVAAPAELPFGSKVSVPGYNRGRPVPVLDRGGAIKGDRLDVFCLTHDGAKEWGRRWVPVTIEN